MYYTGLATFLWAIINADLQHTPLEAVQSRHTCLQWETKKPQISSWLAPSSYAQLRPCGSKTEADIQSFSIVGRTFITKPTSPVVNALEGRGTGEFADCFFLDCLERCHIHFLAFMWCYFGSSNRNGHLSHFLIKLARHAPTQMEGWLAFPACIYTLWMWVWRHFICSHGFRCLVAEVKVPWQLSVLLLYGCTKME